MTKGSYTVGENGSTPARKDTSYRSFICALLIFLCICLIILLASINWGNSKSDTHGHDGSERAHQKGDDVEVMEKDKTTPNTSHEKLKVEEDATEKNGIFIKLLESTTAELGLTEDTAAKPNGTQEPIRGREDATEKPIIIKMLESTTVSSAIIEGTTRPALVETTERRRVIQEIDDTLFLEEIDTLTEELGSTTSITMVDDSTTTKVDAAYHNDAINNTQAEEPSSTTATTMADDTTTTKADAAYYNDTRNNTQAEEPSSTTATTTADETTTTKADAAYHNDTRNNTQAEESSFTTATTIADDTTTTKADAAYYNDTRNNTQAEESSFTTATTIADDTTTTKADAAYYNDTRNNTQAEESSFTTATTIADETTTTKVDAAYHNDARKNTQAEKSSFTTATTIADDTTTTKADAAYYNDTRNNTQAEESSFTTATTIADETTTTKADPAYHNDTRNNTQAEESSFTTATTIHSDTVTANSSQITPVFLSTPQRDEETPTDSTDNESTTKIIGLTTESTQPRALPLIQTTTEDPKNVSYSSTSTTEVSVMESEGISIETTDKPLQIRGSPNLDPPCNTADCKSVAARILSKLNYSAEPCDDFYEFACGGASYNEDESNDLTAASILDTQLEGTKDFKEFYDSCLQYEFYFNYRERMEGLDALLAEIGTFQLGNSIEVDLTDLVSALLLRQSMPLFDIGVDVARESQEFILQLTLPHQSFLRTGIENWSGLSELKKKCLKKQKPLIRGSHVDLDEVYKSFQSCQKDYTVYIDSIEAVIRELKAFSVLDPERLKAEINEIRFNIEFDVLNNLDSLPPQLTIMRSFIKKEYEVRKISDLNQLYPIFDWKKLFGRITGRQVNENTLVQVYFGQYFQGIFAKVQAVGYKRKLYNAFLAIHAYDLFINTVIPKEDSNRNRFCFDLSKNLLPDVWSYFAQASISAEKQRKQNAHVSDLFVFYRNKLCESLRNAEWIDKNTTKPMVSKCESLEVATATFPGFSTLSNNYEKIDITKDYQRNLINLMTNYKRLIYSTGGTPFTPTTIFSYFLDPLGRKPKTFYASPIIAVPLGLTGSESQIAFALARQIARHFDPTGMTYGLQLQSTSKSTYSDLELTMSTQMDYSSPRIVDNKNISFTLNGSLSVNERIVDNMAFRLVQDGLKFSPNILPWIPSLYSKGEPFFITFAQDFCRKTSTLNFMLQVFEQRHLPAVLRVQNIMGNSKEFVSNFSCPDGSGMDFYTKLQFPFLETVEVEDLEEGYNLELSK